MAAVENDAETRFTEIEGAVRGLLDEQEFPVDRTLVIFGLQQRVNEDIISTCQELMENGLGIIRARVIRAKRLVSRNDKPGIVKLELQSNEHKIAALRVKANLRDSGYRGVFIRSSLSLTERVMHGNMRTLLQMLPNGEQYKTVSNGRVVKIDQQRMGAWSRGPPVTHGEPTHPEDTRRSHASPQSSFATPPPPTVPLSQPQQVSTRDPPNQTLYRGPLPGQPIVRPSYETRYVSAQAPPSKIHCSG